MLEGDLRVEASHEDLMALKEALYQAVEDVDLQEDPELRVGEHGEALLIGLVVALGGASLTIEVARTVRRWMQERTERQKLDVIRLYLETRDGTTRDLTLENLLDDVGVPPEPDQPAESVA